MAARANARIPAFSEREGGAFYQTLRGRRGLLPLAPLRRAPAAGRHMASSGSHSWRAARGGGTLRSCCDAALYVYLAGAAARTTMLL